MSEPDGGRVARRILVVDDTEEIGDMTRLILQAEGHEVLTARSGEEALALLELERPDLLLLDINMPGMDGWEVLRLLQVSPGGAPPVVMFSVKMQVHDKVQALQEGAVDYICKPFSPEELAARVRRVFESLEVAP